MLVFYECDNSFEKAVFVNLHGVLHLVLRAVWMRLARNKDFGAACFLLEEVLISLYTPVGIAGGNLLLLFNNYAFDSVPLTIKAAKALGLTTR